MLSCKFVCSLTFSKLNQLTVSVSSPSFLCDRTDNTYSDLFLSIFNMSVFATRRHPLAGPAFMERYGDLNTKKSIIFETLTRYAALMSPRKWQDRLSSHQTDRFHYVRAKSHFTAGLASRLAEDLTELPCVAVSLSGDFYDKFLSVATPFGRVFCFSLRSLQLEYEEAVDPRHFADHLPIQIKNLLASPGVTVIVSEPPNQMARRNFGITINSMVDTTALYHHYEDAGIIRPKVEAMDGTLDWQSAYAVSYHHCQGSYDDLRQLLGRLEFKHGRRPPFRRPGWKPTSHAPVLTENEAFFLYYQAAAMQLFLSRLLRHGLVYGGIPSLRSVDDLKSAYASFLDHAARVTANFHATDQDSDSGDEGGDEDDDDGGDDAAVARPDPPTQQQGQGLDPTHPLAALARDRTVAAAPRARSVRAARPPSPPRSPTVEAKPVVDPEQQMDGVQFTLPSHPDRAASDRHRDDDVLILHPGDDDVISLSSSGGGGRAASRRPAQPLRRGTLWKTGAGATTVHFLFV